MSRPVATVSVDVDPVDLHLEGYGASRLARDPLVYRVALGRLLERFAHFGVRATFFIVTRDAQEHAAALRAVAAAGHELASHSLTHPMALSRLPRAALTEELQGSKRQLEEATGVEVVGFRAPNFDLDLPALAEVAAAGYRYDASGYPTPLLLAARLLLAAKSADPTAALGLTWWPFTWRRAPHLIRAGGREIAEFPTAVTPWLRLPVYHTLRLLGSAAAFGRRLEDFARRGESLCYALHAVDVLGLHEDRVDARLSRHPGMTMPLAHKLAALDDVLARIMHRFEVRTFRERLAET